ncbi:hypothetical protein BDP27DRAFT_1428067 [Rhodocollybia butyracea]|uniref:GCM domain-containing protein n=1 Tax=Rhodocollybia butyracea TaxID=206335 RepID=A0A9P5PFK4_9AGAR|nr:hypothetical protein BDP27DRAFT_1428067 [Rhodocollybia butyracea]
MSWFTQLRKYIANAIYPNNPEAHSAPPVPPPATAFDTLPLFNENGIQIGFQRVPHNATAQLNMPPALGTLAGPPKIATSTSRPPTAPVVTAPQPRNWTEIPSFDLTNPALQTSFIPLDPQPPSETQLDQGVIATSLENLNGGEWDPWVNGRFWMDLNYTELLDTKRVAVHWATKGNSSYNGKGSIHSPDIAGGKVRNKKCLGVLCCTNEDCNYIGRPQVTPGGLQKQLDDQCPSCSSALSHETCASRSYIIQWGQVGNDISTSQYRYINGFAHTHSRIPNVARTTSAEDKRFTSTYSNRPKVTPTQLMVGPAAPEGFGPGAAELGQKFASQAYTGYRLRQEKKKNGNGPTSAFGTFEKLQQWKQKHPDATCKDFVSNDIVCITLQTDWMRQQLMPDMSGVSEPLGGLLTDAAHKYWDDPNGRLIVTSIYSPLIQKWVPVLFSYANGSTAAHYEYHFLILIESIAEVAAERGISISDEHLVGVVDFSDPERIGFQDAYCTYFLAQPNDPRLEEQLRAAAKKLLKGCLYHYLKAVERIAKMSTMVDPNTKSEFRVLAASLPKLQTPAEFHDAVLQIQQKWPRASSWLNWWLNIDHAAMLFECMRAMPSHLASKLPETTNPEEAIHANIHRAVGKNHPFFAGLDGLLVVIKWYRQQVQNAQLGIKNHYGKSGQEVRKALKAKFGTTHPSRKYPKAKARERRKGRNEGNPPYRPRKTISRLRCSKKPIISPLRKRNHLAKSSTHHRSSHQLVNSESSTDSTYLPESHTHSDSSTSLDSASVNDSGSDAPPNPSKEQSTLIGAQQKLRHMSPSKLNAKSAESQFHAIQLSTMHELPGPAWTNNSCWLDSSMEALFCPMAFYGSLAEFKSIITTAEEDPSSPSPLYCLYLAFQFRMAEGINKFQRPSLGPVSPFRQPAEEITNIRDAFRKVLHETHTVEGKVGAYQMPLGWLDNLLPNNSPACDFFKPHSLQFWKCMHEGTGMQHCLITPHIKPIGWSPLGRQWDQYHGKIQSWFSFLCQPSLAITVKEDSGCWRKETEKDEIVGVCPGSSQVIELLTEIPVILIITPDVTVGKYPLNFLFANVSYPAEKYWDFPMQLLPGSEAAAKKGVVYELVSRIFFGHQHYTTHMAIPTTSKAKAVFIHDGMMFQGYSQHSKGKVADLLAGAHPPCASGFTTFSAIYKLKGGVDAQQKFRVQQQVEIKNTLDINIENQPIPALDSPNWIPCSTSSKRSREYNFTSSGVPTKLFVDAPFPTLDGPSGDDFQLGDPTYLSDDSESITHLLLSTLENEFTSPAPVISTDSNLSISSSPLPSSPHHILCRCGVESNGYRESIEQMTVQCAICKNYTHTGCITMRFNGQIPKHFECDDCRFPEVQHVLRDGFAHFRNTLPGLRKQKLASIANRLFPGKGILVCQGGTYYYPARLIAWDKKLKTGTVEMWRGIQSPAAARGIIDNVSLPDIVDGLWQDQDGRRTIQLGSYIRPLEEQIHKQEAEDDLLVNPTTVRCSSEIAAVLQPHRVLLMELAINPEKFSLKQVPALALQNSKDLISGNATYYTGGLLATQVAEINNWIHTKIPMADKLDINMMLRPTIGHARTLVVAHLFRSEFMGDIEDGTLEQKVLEKAWKRLKDWTGRTTTGKPRPKIVDVNFEAISLLDKIMFDESERAGAAGNHQWGLDIGPHELAWTPQINHHSVTTDKRRDGKDEETLHGKNYDFVAEQYEMERAKERRNNQQARSKAPKRKKPEVTPAEDTSKERKERPTRNPKRTRLHQ